MMIVIFCSSRTYPCSSRTYPRNRNRYFEKAIGFQIKLLISHGQIRGFEQDSKILVWKNRLQSWQSRKILELVNPVDPITNRREIGMIG